MNFSISASAVVQPFTVAQLGALDPSQRDQLPTALIACALRNPPKESGSRALAAFHEAGHVVVGAALGYVIDLVRIGQEGQSGLWQGRTTHHVPGERRAVLIAAESPEVAERIATMELAGFIAEAQLGPPHPWSSFEERWRAALVCATIDDATGCSHGTTLERVVARACTLIDSHSRAFDMVAAMLMGTTRLARRQVDRVLRSCDLQCQVIAA